MEYNQNQRPAENGQPIPQQPNPYQQPYVQQPRNPYSNAHINRCPKCGSDRISAQLVTTSQLVAKHRGCLWWCFVGWWWLPIKWIVFTLPALLIKIFGGKRQKIKQSQHTEFVCQNCGHHWSA